MSNLPKSAQANAKIAPWYNVYTLAQQWEMKSKHCRSYLDALGMSDRFQGILHTPPYEGYRNNNKFTFGYGLEAPDIPTHDPSMATAVRLGFIGGKYPTCHILPPAGAITIDKGFIRISATIEEIIQKQRLKPFLPPPKTKRNKKEVQTPYIPHQGVWYYLKVRHSVAENRYSVLLVNFIRHIDIEKRRVYEETIQEMQEALAEDPQVAIFSVQEYHATLEPQPYDPIRVIFDRSDRQEGTLRESLLGYDFQVSPTSFFQVNTKAAELLYRQIYERAEKMIATSPQGKKNILLDLYCGTGSMGICLSQLFDQIIGVDEVDSSIQNAEKNSLLNGVKNTRYVVGKCEDSLEILNHALEGEAYNLYMVVNPARDGLHRKVRKFIKQSQPLGLIYSSCNAETWARDVDDLCHSSEEHPKLQPLTIESALAVDLFPHTPHYEVVSSFSSCSLQRASDFSL